MTRRAIVEALLLSRHGRTYAQEAGITLRDKPSPLYRLLVLSTLLAARIGANVALAAARELSRAGYRTPERMRSASWQQRVDALGRGHYRRYDESTARMLGDGAELLIARHRSDLRTLRGGDAAAVRKRLEEFPGIGPVGSSIFCREVQGVWPELSPFLDRKVLDGARILGLPSSPEGLAGLVSRADLPRLAAGCVRVALDPRLAEALRD